MSYLSTTLQRQAEQRRLTQADLARGSGLSASFISRLLSGGSAEISDTNFIALLSLFAAEPLAQAELIAARCRDACVGPNSDLVLIQVKSDRTTGANSPAPPVPQIQLAQETERAFAWLRSQCPLNPELEKHLIGYARLMGMR